MTLEQSNVELIRQTYADFVRGNITAVRERLGDDVEWIAVGPAEIPWNGIRRGKPAAAEFLEILARELTIRVFEAAEYIGQGERVVALVRFESTINRNGGALVDDLLHLWRVRDGKIVSWRGFSDTAGALAAWRGRPAA